jgi:hypothetical protein
VVSESHHGGGKKLAASVQARERRFLYWDLLIRQLLVDERKIPDSFCLAPRTDYVL